MIDREHDIPALGGVAKKGHTIYEDRHLPKVAVISGKKINPGRFIAIHESTEFPLMEKGMPYEKAHKIATKAEKAAVEREGLNWKEYCAFVNGVLSHVEKEPLKRVPKNLDPRPYKEGDWPRAKVDQVVDGGKSSKRLDRSRRGR